MNKQKCKLCGEEFTAKRADAKFCSLSCKSQFWNQNRQEKDKPREVASSLQSKLKGVLNSDNSTDVEAGQVMTKIIDVETDEYLAVKTELDRTLRLKDKLRQEWETLNKEYKKVISDDGSKNILYGIASGAMVAGYKKYGIGKTLLSIGGGSLAGLFYNTLTDDFRKKSKAKKVTEILKANNALNDKYTNITKQETILREKLAKTPRFEPKTIEIAPEKKTEIILKKDISQLAGDSTINQVQEQSPVNDKINVNDTNNKPINDKIMTSINFMKYEYKKLKFTDRWLEFIGLPSITFHIAIYGKPGGGKSTFAMMLAKYLADYFGTVIYISGEEGFSSTLQEKIMLTKAATNNLYIAASKTFEDVIKDVPTDTFNFIVIDSLNDMDIDIKKLKILKETYKDSAFITISQATKSGNMRGSLEIIHDADTEIKVEKGIATTNKNRFGKPGLEFKVF